MKFQWNDGGRSVAFKGKSGDCVTRAVSIASGLPYSEVYAALSIQCRSERASTKRSARNGVHTKRKWFKAWMHALGWRWTPTMQIGSGCKVHLRDGELPQGRLIVSLSKHYCAVIDGVIHDTSDPQRGGTRCVYGYWQFGNPTP